MLVFLLYFCLPELIGNHKHSGSDQRQLSMMLQEEASSDRYWPRQHQAPSSSQLTSGQCHKQWRSSSERGALSFLPSSGPHIPAQLSLTGLTSRGHLCVTTRQSGGRGLAARPGSRSGPSTPPPASVRASGTEAAGPRRTSSATRTNVVWPVLTI